jgi:hypothetical protein
LTLDGRTHTLGCVRPRAVNLLLTAALSVAVCVPAIAEQDARLGASELQEYYATYKRPEVKYLRTVMNAHLKGESRRDLAYGALKDFDSAYYRSKFIVITIVTPSGGGALMQIMFQDRPDSLFKAWVWEDSHNRNRLELRQFERVDVGPETIAALQKKWKSLLDDKVHAM